jgi:ubiquinone/menaquinone biosynthesis C-methylase UbiE
MVKPRISHTDHGITGEFNTKTYDKMMRRLRDRGWILETKMIIGAGISSGLALELGPGPVYLGLEWLKHTQGTILWGQDISEDMIDIAERNAREYNLTDRVKYVRGDAVKMPLESEYFDAVFSNGSLHEWANPEEILNEIARVLKPGGRYFISDFRRDMNFIVKWFVWFMNRPKVLRPELVESFDASYVVGEVEALLARTKLQGWHVSKNPLGLVVSGQKPIRA